MDIFEEKPNSIKAGNVTVLKSNKIIIDLENEIIRHEVKEELRDSDGDVIKHKYVNIDISSEEFPVWVTDDVIAATRQKLVDFYSE